MGKRESSALGWLVITAGLVVMRLFDSSPDGPWYHCTLWETAIRPKSSGSGQECPMTSSLILTVEATCTRVCHLPPPVRASFNTNINPRLSVSWIHSG